MIVAFNRVDYFRQKFNAANERNYAASVGAGLANNVFMPLYGLAFNLAQLIVLAYGFYLIAAGSFTVGLLIGFLLYVNSFYMPLRQLAAVWSSFQLALAGLDRISDGARARVEHAGDAPADARPLRAPCSRSTTCSSAIRGGQDGAAGRARSRSSAGKTYALVGPTGGGKTTTASLMARLYDPTGGRVLLDGTRHPLVLSRRSARERSASSCRSRFSSPARSATTSSTATTRYQRLPDERDRGAAWRRSNLDGLLARFEQGLATKVTAGGDGISLGQKQLIAFMRAVLREPEILILDEATANIDTVTEQLLEQILDKLPAVDDQGHHRAPPEHDRERRRDLLHQRRRDHARRLDAARARHAAARQARELTTF